MSSKLWQKLFSQAIPFFALLYMIFAIVWISAEYVLAFLGLEPVGDLSVTLATGIPIAILAVVLSAFGDHWLQDRYGVDNDGKPHDLQPKK